MTQKLQESVTELLGESPLLEAPRKSAKRKTTKRKTKPKSKSGRSSRGTKVDYWRTMPGGHKVGFRKRRGKKRGLAVTGHPTLRKKINKESVERANQLVETTLSSLIPTMPNPLSGAEFTEQEQAAIVQHVKRLFPNATDEAVKAAIFGGGSIKG